LTVVSEPSTRAGVVVLRLAGVLDRHAVGTAREAMSGALRGHPREVVLEVSGLERVDHVASVVLTLMHRHAARCGARLAVVPGPG
jgi:anti-anti-sigma regulatory factor